jgi:hypothetical protein
MCVAGGGRRISIILTVVVLFGLTLSSCSKEADNPRSTPSKNVVTKGKEFMAKTRDLITETENAITKNEAFKDNMAKFGKGMKFGFEDIEDPVKAFREEEDFVRVQI